jgi:hypothetical protein
MSTYAVFVLNCTRKDCQSCTYHPYHFDKLPVGDFYDDVGAPRYVIVDKFDSWEAAADAADMLNELVRS